MAKGFTQRLSHWTYARTDFDETYAPVVKYDSLRTILLIAGVKDMGIIQLDIKTAFLNGELQEQSYMNQPEGFDLPGREKEVCLLKKSLYGLKQASRTWNKTFD